MACNCCNPRVLVCCTPTTESVEYAFENANLVGIGVFDNETDNLVQFRGLVSNSSALTITLNGTDKTLVFDFDDAALVADIPNATTTQRGILETATNAEALAKAAADKILTPSNLAALGGSTTFAGLLELATEAETIAGVSTTLAVTPAGLAAAGQLTGTTTWADAVTRLGADPTFDGQIGVQLDTNSPWLANGTAVGDFDIQIPSTDADFLISDSAAVTWTANNDLTLDGATSANLNFDNFFSIFVNSPTEFTSSTKISAGGVLDFDGGTFGFGGVAAADDQLIGTSGAGVPASIPISNFISTNDTQTGYTAFANGVVRHTCDTTTVTLPELAQIVGTLIEDLKAIQLPAT